MRTEDTSFYNEYYFVLWGTFSITVFVFCWEIVSRSNLVPYAFIGSPVGILKAAITLFQSSSFWQNLSISARALISGYILATLVGVVVGIIVGWYKLAQGILEPFITALYSTPSMALLPMMIIWFGIGIKAKIFLIFLMGVFPILINTQAAVRTIDPQLRLLSKSFGANDWQLFRDIILPGSVPQIISGLRLAVGRSLIGVIVGEMYASAQGIGYLAAVYGSTFQTDKMFVAILIIVAAGMSLTSALRRLERAFDKWRV